MEIDLFNLIQLLFNYLLDLLYKYMSILFPGIELQL